MLFRLILYLSGIMFCSFGVVFIVIYLNLLNMGYNFMEYVHFIIFNPECLIIFIGMFNIFLALKRKGNKNGLRIWYVS